MKVLIENNKVIAINQSAIARCILQDNQELVDVDLLPKVGQERKEGVFFDVDSTAQEEYEWAKAELEYSDIEIKYHERNSKRAKLTVGQWYEYQEQLRDYASVDDSDDYSTSGDRPTRPS